MLLIHRCRRCQHPDYYSPVSANIGSAIADYDDDPGGRLYRRHCGQSFDINGLPTCKTTCLSQGCDWGPPEFASEFRGDGSIVDELHPPGDNMFGINNHANRSLSCCCIACQATYDRHRRNVAFGPGDGPPHLYTPSTPDSAA